MDWICATIMCIVFSIGFDGLSISIIKKIESIFGIDKDLLELGERIKNLEVCVENLIRE